MIEIRGDNKVVAIFCPRCKRRLIQVYGNYVCPYCRYLNPHEWWYDATDINDALWVGMYQIIYTLVKAPWF